MLIGLILDHNFVLAKGKSGVEAPLKKSALNGLKVYVYVDKVTTFFLHSHLRIAMLRSALLKFDL